MEMMLDLLGDVVEQKPVVSEELAQKRSEAGRKAYITKERNKIMAAFESVRGLMDSDDPHDKLQSLLMNPILSEADKISTLQRLTGTKHKELWKLVNSAEKKFFFKDVQEPCESVALRLKEFDVKAVDMAKQAMKEDPSLLKVGLNKVLAMVKDWMRSNLADDGATKMVAAIVQQAMDDILECPVDPSVYQNGCNGMWVDAMCFLFDEAQFDGFLEYYGVGDSIQCDPQGEITERIAKEGGIKVREWMDGFHYRYDWRVVDEAASESSFERAIAFFAKKSQLLNEGIGEDDRVVISRFSLDFSDIDDQETVNG